MLVMMMMIVIIIIIQNLKFILGSEACSNKTRVSTCVSGILLFYFLELENQVWIICILIIIYQNWANQM